MTHDELSERTVALDATVYISGATRHVNLVEYSYVDPTLPRDEDGNLPTVCLSLLHPEHGRIMTLDGYTVSA